MKTLASLLLTVLFLALTACSFIKPQSTVNPTPTSTPIANAAPKASVVAVVADEYSDLSETECRVYMTTLKKLTTCSTLDDKQRADFTKTYNETLKSLKLPIKDADGRKLRASICKMSGDALKSFVAKCGN